HVPRGQADLRVDAFRGDVHTAQHIEQLPLRIERVAERFHFRKPYIAVEGERGAWPALVRQSLAEQVGVQEITQAVRVHRREFTGWPGEPFPSAAQGAPMQ